jgi:hypothetical protein
MSRVLLLGVLLTLLLSPAGVSAQELTIDAEVVSVRGDRVYLELREPLAVEVALGSSVQVEGGSAQAVTAVLAVSSKFLVVEHEGVDGLGLAAGDTLRVKLRGQPRQGASARPSGGESGTSAPIVIGRRQPTESDYQATPPPTLEKVSFRRLPQPDDGRRPDSPEHDGREPDPDGEEPDGEPVDREREVETNDVRGELVIGVDSLFDDDADVSRVTPYGRLRLEIDGLGGSDRARFVFYGSVRQPFDGNPDWTGHHGEDLNANLTALALEIDARPEGQIESFSDRLELGLGRQAVPDVLEAGLIDGLRAGVRAGPIVAFAFGGFAVSPNPQREDYESLVYGGGLRFTKSFPHSGAIRISLAGAQERFRGEGERDWVESRFDLRYGSFGARGALVVDLYEQLVDRRKIRITTAFLSAYAQLSKGFRMELGYRERRSAYQADIFRTVGGTDVDPLVHLLLPRDERRTYYTAAYLTFLDTWTIDGRLEYYQARESQDAFGGGVGLSVVLATRHRVRLDVSARHRMGGPGVARHSTDPFVSLTYGYQGDSFGFGAGFYYRSSLPDSAGDSRVGLRLNTDVDIGRGFGIRGYAGFEFRRVTGDSGSGELFQLGLAGRYRF